MAEWLVQDCGFGGVQNWMWTFALAFALYLLVLALLRLRARRADE
jgi:hypothetical protein